MNSIVLASGSVAGATQTQIEILIKEVRKMAQYPRIEINKIDKLGISFKSGVAKISFEVPLPGTELLKLIYMQATGQPMSAVIESPQAEFDLVLTTVNVKTGEVVNSSKVTEHVKD